jgi:hypothetical protein
MPYISKNDRENLEGLIGEINITFSCNSITPGILNYLISTICKTYLERKGENYTHHNDIIGVLECVKQEWYRRKTVPYENKKIKENGDIYV